MEQSPSPQAPLAQISDAANAPGRTGFYFLAPMVPDPSPFTGTFDATLSPEVRVCQLVAATPPATGHACGTTIKTFTPTTASEPLLVSTVGESYNVTWKTKNNPVGLAAGKAKYRVEVRVGAALLGFADLWFVTSNKELATIEPGFVGVVLGSPLNIKFRIETQTVGTITVSPPSAIIGVASTQPFSAEVLDLHGNAVASPAIMWASDNPAVATVNPASGTATGVSAGTATIFATSGGVSGTATLTVNAVATAKLGLVTQPSATAQSGVAFGQQPVVELEDAQGNPVAQAGVTVTVEGPGAGGPVLGGTLSAVTDANGRATFTDLALTGQTGSSTLTFQATGLASIVSNAITLSAGAAAKLAFSSQPSNTTAGVGISPAVAVEILDASGNLVTTASNDVTVAIGTNSGGGSLSGTVTAAAVNGVATFSNLSINKIGTGYDLLASATGLTGATSGSFTITAGAPATIIKLTGDGVTAIVGTASTPVPSVLVSDALGNPVAGVSVTFAPSVGGTVTGSPATTNGSGIAMLGSWTLATTAGPNTLVASAGGLAATFAATGTADVAATVTVTPGTATITGGGTQLFSATVADQYGNVRGDGVDWSSSDALVAPVSPSSGTSTTVTTLSVTADVNVTITATLGGISGTAVVTVKAPGGGGGGGTNCAVVCLVKPVRPPVVSATPPG